MHTVSRKSAKKFVIVVLQAVEEKKEGQALLLEGGDEVCSQVLSFVDGLCKRSIHCFRSSTNLG